MQHPANRKVVAPCGEPAGKEKGHGIMYYATVAFCSTLLFLVALRRAAHRFGLIDKPSFRKTHLGEIPVNGGLAIGSAFVTTLFLQAPQSPRLVPFAVASVIVLATGLVGLAATFVWWQTADQNR